MKDFIQNDSLLTEMYSFKTCRILEKERTLPFCGAGKSFFNFIKRLNRAYFAGSAVFLRNDVEYHYSEME